MRRLLPLLTAFALLATACQGDQPSATTLEDGADGVDVAQSTPAPEATTPADGPPSGQPAGDAIDPRADEPIEAQPGRWAVADAGFVTFDLTDDGLVLDEVVEQAGWSARVDEESADEIEVDFTGDGGVAHEIEVERDGGLEVDIRTEVVPADPGAYDLGAAGSVEFALDGGDLRLVDVIVAEGWELRVEEESAEEIELTLVRGAERWEVQIEEDDGQVELEMDYRVRGDR